MPVIEDTSQESALRLQRAAEPLSAPDDEYRIVSSHSGTVWLVSDPLLAAYQTDVATQPAPTEPACRSGNPCYSPACTEDVVYQPPTLASIAPTTAAIAAPNTTVTLTGTNFDDPMTATIDPPGLDTTLINVPVTVVSPTSATVVVPASALDTAGPVTITVTTGYGTTVTRTLTVA